MLMRPFKSGVRLQLDSNRWNGLGALVCIIEWVQDLAQYNPPSSIDSEILSMSQRYSF